MSVPLVPVTVSTCVVLGVAEAPTKMFMMVVGAPLGGGVTGLSEKDTPTFAGVPETEKLMGELNPPSDVAVIPTDPNVPLLIVTEG